MSNDVRFTGHSVSTRSTASKEFSPQLRTGWFESLAILGFSIVLAIAATWPLALRFSTDLPLGLEQASTVPMLNLWTLWWNSEAPARGFQGYWNAPIFHPTTGTFAFSEAQPTLLLVAPLVWISGNLVAAYNTYLIATLALNGLSTYHLMRAVGHLRLSSCMATLMAILTPYVFWQLGALQLTTFWGAQWAILAFIRWLHSPQWKHAGWFGFWFGMTYAACNYHGLYLSLLLLPAGLVWVNSQWKTWRAVGTVLFALAIGGLLVGPIVMQQITLSEIHDWQRRPETIRKLSATWTDYANVSGQARMPQLEIGDEFRRRNWQIGPGLWHIIMAFCGLNLGLWFPIRRRWTLFAFIILLTAFLWSLGPHFAWGSWAPYELLREHYPGFRQIRSPFRFAIFVHLAVVWLATEFFEILDCWAHRAVAMVCNYSVGWLRVAGLWGTTFGLIAACLMLSIEVWPASQRTFRVPGYRDNSHWLDYLRHETPREATVLCLPLPKGPQVGFHEQEGYWMYFATIHQRRLLNGYSGFFPQPYLDLRSQLSVAAQSPDGSWNWQTDIQDEGRLKALFHSGADYIVVLRSGLLNAALLEASSNARSMFDFVLSDEIAGIDIYKVRHASQ